ncbi:hypothetical protein [Clostridium thermobutyricum]|uniref:hypothetical protein n=1 Tax=Clostridium thermobutyricum TaxID=29372 RepID=UPI0018A925B1|nr:hypothetical protein [Clostridium thermobutyricum]
MNDLKNKDTNTKYCAKCDNYYDSEYMFCPICGKSLESDDIDVSDLAEGFRSVYGRWEVSTYGNFEGSTIEKIGVFEGYIDDIALALADKAVITLKFKPAPMEPEKKYMHKANKVRVSFPEDSYEGEKTKAEFNDIINRLFTYRENVKVHATNIYSFEINKK